MAGSLGFHCFAWLGSTSLGRGEVSLRCFPSSFPGVLEFWGCGKYSASASILNTYTSHFSLALMCKLQQSHSEDEVPSVTASLAVVHLHAPGDSALLYLSLKN